VLCSDSWGSIYDGQADRAMCEFCYENIELAVLVTRPNGEARIDNLKEAN
jgi:hypothetical protein